MIVLRILEVFGVLLVCWAIFVSLMRIWKHERVQLKMSNITEQHEALKVVNVEEVQTKKAEIKKKEEAIS